MASVDSLPAAEARLRLNVTDRLAKFAVAMPDAVAVVCPRRRTHRKFARVRGKSGTAYSTTTFAELDADASRIARGLLGWGVPPGTRLALLVRPGIEFVTLVFALLRAGMVIVLVDPGLGRRHLIRCLAESEPEGFVAIGAAQAARMFYRSRFPRARWNVTVGRRWFWGGMTLDRLRARGEFVGWAPPTKSVNEERMVGSAHPTYPDDPAAIIFTSGSTGPPKGVLYTQRMFDTQVAEIQAAYNIEPGGVDLACFPLFALFNAAMGVTTVMPEMDFSRPATADPTKLLAAANDWQVSQAFASPAVWRVLSAHCAQTGERIDSLRQVFSCGAPVPADVLRATLACVGRDAKMHTPYGATECLPVATIEAAEVLSETAARTNQGGGVCVGKKFDSIDWRIIRITDEPIGSIDDAAELPCGEIGELVVRGTQVSPTYVTCKDANATAKIGIGGTEYSVPSTQYANDAVPALSPSRPCFWHRTGDVGYIDNQGWFWYCGRKSQRVKTADGPLFTECVEAIFNTHPDVRRTALVGLGDNGDQLPVIFFEPYSVNSRTEVELSRELYEIGQRFNQTRCVRLFAKFDRLPVDVRHNSKILRETLVEWAKELNLQCVGDSSLQ